MIDALAHPEPATCTVRCDRISVSSTDHSTGPALGKLDEQNVIILESVNNIWLSRLNPGFADLTIVQPTFPVAPVPADTSDVESTSDSDSLSESESGSSSDSETSVDSAEDTEETEETEDPPAVPAVNAGADNA
jgi:hypothetical protein